MYIGAIMPWSEFNQPDVTGLTYGRLVALGFLVLVFRRIPAIFVMYKLMPGVCKDWKEALFMGYFGPIGAGAVFYLEHTRNHLFHDPGAGDPEVSSLVQAIGPVVMWLVFFSIVVHGLSIPALDFAYRCLNIKPIQEDAVETRRLSINLPTPSNAIEADRETFIQYNRFSRPTFDAVELPFVNPKEDYPASASDSTKMSKDRAITFDDKGERSQ